MSEVKRVCRRINRRTVWMLLATAALWLPWVAGCSMMAQGENVQGVRLYQQGNFQAALQNFQRALQNDPNNADAYYNLAATHHRLGALHNTQSDKDQAESFYNQCLDRHPDHQACYRALAVLLVEQQRSEEAFRLMEGWVDRSPTRPEPKIELARLFEEFGDKQAAKAHLVEAVALDPSNARGLAALGRIREELGEYQQAIADYQRSLQSDRFQPNVVQRVAALQAATGPNPADIIGPPGSSPTRTVNTSPTVLR